MLAIDDDQRTTHMQVLDQSIRNLGSQPFLHLGTLGVGVDQSGEKAAPAFLRTGTVVAIGRS